MNIPARSTSLVQLNIAPLVDVIFILLIFTVVAAKFADQERLDVTLPSAAAGKPAELDALMIEIDEQGAIAVEGRLIAPEDLDAEVRTQRRNYDRVVLLADQRVRLQPAVDVISTVKLAGYDAVALATKQPEP